MGMEYRSCWVKGRQGKRENGSSDVCVTGGPDEGRVSET